MVHKRGEQSPYPIHETITHKPRMKSCSDLNDPNDIYVGEADFGTAEDAAGWYIERIVKVNGVVKVLATKASASSTYEAYDKAWDHRKDGTYTYE